MFHRLVVALLIFFAHQLVARADDVIRVYVVTGAEAPALERFAAEELAGQFKRLFEVEVVAANAIPEGARQVVLIGSPATNAAVEQAIGSKWPKLSDQGLVLKSAQAGGADVLVVGGETPRGTLWAVYELGHRYGIRYMLREDIFPLEKQPLKLDGFDVTLEPELRTRTWRTINDFAIGPASWGVADHKKFLRQLAKLKYNGVILSIHPWQPFVDYEFGGVKKQSAMLRFGNQYRVDVDGETGKPVYQPLLAQGWIGERFRVDGETVGKKAFRGAEFFENPDFAGKQGYAEMTAAGIAHARGIIAEARRLGMTVGIAISPLEFPREFQQALHGLQVDIALNDLTILPRAQQGPDDKLLKQAAAAKIRAYLATYPEIDKLYLTLPEFYEWEQHAEAAWKQLSARHDLGDLTLEKLIASARERKLVVWRKGERLLKGNLVALAFLGNLFEDESLLKRPDGGKVQLVVAGVDPALYSLLDRVLPPGAGALHSIDYTAGTVAEHTKLLAQVPADKVRSQHILTLGGKDVGILPQSSLADLETLAGALKELGWDGFAMNCWMPAELDSSVYFLSRAAWDDVTPREAYFDLWETITGNKAATERLWLGEEHRGRATALIDLHHPGFTFPADGMMRKHYEAAEIPDWWQKANEHYTQSMIELYRAHGAIDPRARKILFYYAKRGEYALSYLAAVKSTREAANAKKAGDDDKAIEHMEAAVESMYNAITTLSDVALDQSDRGLIAVLNEFAYRPLVKEYEKLLDAE